MLLLWTRDVIKTKSFCIEGYVIFIGRRCYYKQYPFVSGEYVTFIIDGLAAEFNAITWFSVLEFRTVIVIKIIFFRVLVEVDTKLHFSIRGKYDNHINKKK